MSDELAQVRARLDALNGRLAYLEEKVDLFRSRIEVPRQLVDEFQRWKAATPIPEHPLVSVAIATYNRARLLTERSIPSVLAQTYDNLELVVVGDGCDDETEDLVAKIDDRRLKFVNLPERGNYPEERVRRWLVAGTPAMNKAMSLATGDYVTHLDDDDEYAADRIEKLVDFARSNQLDLVWHPCWAEIEDGSWQLVDAHQFAYAQVTTSSVFYRSWFTNIEWDPDAHLQLEPGDWNRFRKIKYVGAVMSRYPEPLLKHYRQMNQPT